MKRTITGREISRRQRVVAALVRKEVKLRGRIAGLTRELARATAARRTAEHLLAESEARYDSETPSHG